MTKLSQPQASGEKLYVLSERISQDPLENYFGKQRARGVRNENPISSNVCTMPQHCVSKNQWLWTQLEVIAVEREDFMVISSHR